MPCKYFIPFNYNKNYLRKTKKKGYAFRVCKYGDEYYFSLYDFGYFLNVDPFNLFYSILHNTCASYLNTLTNNCRVTIDGYLFHHNLAVYLLMKGNAKLYLEFQDVIRDKFELNIKDNLLAIEDIDRYLYDNCGVDNIKYDDDDDDDD